MIKIWRSHNPSSTSLHGRKVKLKLKEREKDSESSNQDRTMPISSSLFTAHLYASPKQLLHLWRESGFWTKWEWCKLIQERTLSEMLHRVWESWVKSLENKESPSFGEVITPTCIRIWFNWFFKSAYMTELRILTSLSIQAGIPALTITGASLDRSVPPLESPLPFVTLWT